MTENNTETDSAWPIIPLQECEFTFGMTIDGVDSLAEAFDVASLSLIQQGLDSFHVIAKDLSSGKQWVIHDGGIRPIEEVMDEMAAGMHGDGRPDGADAE